MFTEHPDTKSYFTHFKGMDSADEMKQSDQVRGHGKKVFTAINDMVQHLDNSEAFLGIVNPLGKKHATQLKIDPKNFRVSQQPSSQWGVIMMGRCLPLGVEKLRKTRFCIYKYICVYIYTSKS